MLKTQYLMVGCHYFLPDPEVTFQPQSQYQIILLTVCMNNLASQFVKVEHPGSESTTF